MANSPKLPHSIMVGQRTANIHIIALTGLLALLALLTILSLAVGALPVALNDIWQALHGQNETVSQSVVQTRIPRTLMAIIAGSVLGLSGTMMQGITRNPLADPGILGINMGASLAVVIGVAWFQVTAATSYIGLAILGACCSAILVYSIGFLGSSSKRNGASPLKLALAGAAISAVFSSFIMAIVLPRNDIASTIRAWQNGSVGGATYEYITYSLPFLAIGGLICFTNAHKLNLLAMGDDIASSLGARVLPTRIVILCGAVFLCGATTAVCGPIGFVGLIVPHLCRLVVGINYRWLTLFSGIMGACLLLLSDIIGRTIAAPAEINVGIITALVGAPFFIWVVRHKKVHKL